MAYLSLLLVAAHFTTSTLSFQIHSGTSQRHHGALVPLFDRKLGGKGFKKEDPIDSLADLSEERKANLFQTLLRDLQIEGVPLLEVDATQVHTLQAAVWTTIAELADQPMEQKACLVFESIPMYALTAFVDDFAILKTQADKLQYLPEVERVSLSLVGKGVGPAILMEIANETEQQGRSYDTPSTLDDSSYIDAMKAFMNRVVIGENTCPHVSSADEAPSGVQDVEPLVIGYRVCKRQDAFHVLSGLWNCICELYASPGVGTIVLALPSVGTSKTEPTKDNHARFVNIAELMSRYLCLYQGDGIYDLLHFHPDYTRDWVSPSNKPAHGHLPPNGWLRAMLSHNGDSEAANQLSDDDLQLSNYQRRSPVPAVCIKRVEYLDKVTDEKNGVVKLKHDGMSVLASGIPSYARNTQHLAAIGEERLKAGLEYEKRMVDK
jgi:hypothetical protein